MDEKVKITMESLRQNGMEAFFLGSTAEVADKVRELIKPGAVVGTGGSVTLEQTGILDLLRSGEYDYLDRYAPGLAPEDIRQIFADSFCADVYISSSNAITMNGELYNVDGRSNRVAAISYGPRCVIIVTGINKIVPDLTAAIKRVKAIAAPKNCVRLGKKTYCAEKGYCQEIDSDEMTAGCTSPDRICRSYVVTGKQQRDGRIKVILVGEELGY